MTKQDTAKLELLELYTVGQVETMIRRYEYSKAYHAKHNKRERIRNRKAREAGITVTAAEMNA